MLKAVNNFIYRFKYVYAKHLSLTAPVDVSLELSSLCTNACGYCYHADPKNLPFARGFMAEGLAFKIIQQAAEIGAHSIKFNYRGESTMHPSFERVTWYAKHLARGRTLMDRVTNSNFNFKHNREDLFRGLCHQTKVKVSFDSFIKEIFEKQRKGSKYEATITNIDKFYNYPGRRNELVIQSVRTLSNKDEDLEFEIKRRWPSATASIRDCVAGRVNKDLSNVIARDRDASYRQSCIQAHARVIIGHDGRVQVCCPDIGSKLVIGDANTQHLRDIWKSQLAHQVRRDLKTGKAFEADPCKSCSSFESYKGFKPSWSS